MLKITFTDNALDYLKRREIADKTLILITDDGGGKYSIKGGGCSIGSHFSIIWVDQVDPDYPVELENDQGLKIYTSKYDMTMMGPNMVMDYDAGSLNLRLLQPLIGECPSRPEGECPTSLGLCGTRQHPPIPITQGKSQTQSRSMVGKII